MLLAHSGGEQHRHNGTSERWPPTQEGEPCGARQDRRCGVMNRPRQGQPAMFPFRQGLDQYGEKSDSHIQSHMNALAAHTASAFMWL